MEQLKSTSEGYRTVTLTTNQGRGADSKQSTVENSRSVFKTIHLCVLTQAK